LPLNGGTAVCFPLATAGSTADRSGGSMAAACSTEYRGAKGVSATSTRGGAIAASAIFAAFGSWPTADACGASAGTLDCFSLEDVQPPVNNSAARQKPKEADRQ
jgi:hypothetical protein